MQASEASGDLQQERLDCKSLLSFFVEILYNLNLV